LHHKEYYFYQAKGEVGNRITTIKSGEENIEINHGVVIVATGGKEAKTESYNYGKSDKIVTQQSLEYKIGKNQLDSNIKNVVMIQCVDSREKGKREYCSRVCCSHAVKNALKIKELNPECNITVLYRDIRTYGFYENYYREARNKGIIFIPYEVSDKPNVDINNDNVKITFTDPIVNKKITVDTDLLVLSTGIEPNNVEELKEIFGLPVDKYGFFEESNKKTGLTNFMEKDIFMCGLCHAPKHINEAISQAYAAAARASIFLSKQNIVAMDKRSYVKEQFCSGCGICVEVCPYNARIIDETLKIAKVLETKCEGCGTCVMACPNGAAQQYGFEKKQILDVINQYL
jgi:heterodisulfide reductase subunit A